MARQYDFITFDCYGTLIDWESGIRQAFVSAAARDGKALEADAVITTYSKHERAVEHERYRSYREVLTESAVRTARDLDWQIGRDGGAFLPDSLASWKPFPDTNPALERLRDAGYKLGILSNVDNDLLEATRRHFTVQFDLVVTAQQVGSYKPAVNHFNVARERIGHARWLHAAQSNFHDIVPANSLAIPNAWINRHANQPGADGVPTYEFNNLESFAAAMV
jgi:2-haloacid dehalogenase/putative hydrolase of the HAD superfamily